MDRSFYRFVTIHACDRQTDRRTEFSSQYRVCITCSAVKIVVCQLKLDKATKLMSEFPNK